MLWALMLAGCGGSGSSDAGGDGGESAATPPEAPAPGSPQAGYSPPTQYADDYCTTGNYPGQWTWDPALVRKQDAPATSGTPRIEQVRNGVVIATYTSLGGDKGYSKPNSADGGDTSVGPFRRQPYLQWRSGDLFKVYPAVYSGRDMQIYLGPNAVNASDYSAGIFSVPENITIQGVSVNGVRPVIVNPPTGASNSTYGQSLVYIEGRFNASGVLVKPATNITIENIDIVDAAGGGNIGKAGIYVNGAKDLTLRRVRIAGFKRHSANGIFATGNNTGTLLLENVELDGNGGASGPEHNAYINASKTDPGFTFLVRNSWSHDAYYGHALKSRAQRTVVEGSYLSGQRAAAGTQAETYLLDVPDGGILEARNNIFVKNRSGNQSNGASLTFGVESASSTRAWGLTVEHNTFVAFSRYYDDAGHELFPLFIGSRALGDKRIDANVYVGYCPSSNATRNERGTNAAILGFNDIDLSFRPRAPQLTGNGNIVGKPSYEHVANGAQRRTHALGARD
ncbi:hypothetical protein [Eleftheria terrae]|uniref:hypothetical protein n=1 Tax=Eleftheria terrae TaxID=1597781 RepID=UPI00263A7B90|nr:hypothetical protein [Eleftheria terrae]WKB55791.1 hypothetical protein N7L95_27290 [Eleftheria terrae]